MPEPVAERSARLAGVTVLAVFAHPDDESLACGGTLAALQAAGVRVVLLCGSRGERGGSSGPGYDPLLGDARVDELRRAAAVLGIGDVTVLDHPDGELRWSRVAEFQADIALALRRYRPAAVVTFGADGLYWHPDHIGVHERTATAIQAFGAQAPAMYCVTMPPGVMRSIVDHSREQGWTPPSQGFWSLSPDAFGADAAPPAVIINVEPWIGPKLAAIRCHATQFGSNDPFSRLDEQKARRWLGAEHFHRVPGPRSGTEILEQLAG